jgi:hypothetical protein
MRLYIGFVVFAAVSGISVVYRSTGYDGKKKRQDYIQIEKFPHILFTPHP